MNAVDDGVDHPYIVFGLCRVRRAPPLGFVKDLKNLGVRALELRVQGFGFWVLGLGFRV